MPVSDKSRDRLLDLFAKIEARLKRIPRYLHGDEGGRAEANWQRFGSDFSERIAPLVGGQSKEVLTTLPPKPEVVRDGKPSFDEDSPPLRGGRRPETLGMRLVEASCRVRNNTIHGGKQDPALERYAGHDQQVVDAAIEVMEVSLNLLVRPDGRPRPT